MSGEQLIAAACKHSGALLNFFVSLGTPPSESEDLLQETYLRLWRHRDGYVPRAKLSTFLFLLARQVRIDALRKAKRRETRERLWRENASCDSAAGADAAADARCGELRKAVARLPESHRAVVEMAVYREMPYCDISRELSIPVGTVKSRMSCAVKKLRAFMVASLALAAVAAPLALWRREPLTPPGAQNPYTLAAGATPETIAEIVRTQQADGGWGSDFLTARNAAALAKVAPECVALRRARRNLRMRGIATAEPLTP